MYSIIASLFFASSIHNVNPVSLSITNPVLDGAKSRRIVVIISLTLEPSLVNAHEPARTMTT